MYQDGGAQDRADAEEAELKVIESWLPAQASEDTVRKWVEEAIEDAGGIDNVGKIMGALMKKHKNDVDGGMAQRIVKEVIASQQ